MFSLCKTCKHQLSTSAEKCTSCGEVSPFNKKEILALERKLGFQYIIFTAIPSVVVGLTTPLLAINFQSWMIFFVGLGIFGYIHKDTVVDKGHYDFNLEALYRESFQNYLLANKDRKFSDTFDAQRKFSEEILGSGGTIYTKLHDVDEIYNQYYTQ